jgi:hypothetical protein
MNNVNPLFAPIIGFIAGSKPEPVKTDDEIIIEMNEHNRKALSNIRKEGQMIFSRKHCITIDREDVPNYNEDRKER